MRCLSLAAVVMLVFAACDDDHEHDDGHDLGGHTSPYPSCNAITQACHMYDTGEGPLHDCHERAHSAKSDADCAPTKDECLRLCAEAAKDGG
jgi:hypothetical protein